MGNKPSAKTTANPSPALVRPASAPPAVDRRMALAREVLGGLLPAVLFDIFAEYCVATDVMWLVAYERAGTTPALFRVTPSAVTPDALEYEYARALPNDSARDVCVVGDPAARQLIGVCAARGVWRQSVAQPHTNQLPLTTGLTPVQHEASVVNAEYVGCVVPARAATADTEPVAESAIVFLAPDSLRLLVTTASELDRFDLQTLSAHPPAKHIRGLPRNVPRPKAFRTYPIPLSPQRSGFALAGVGPDHVWLIGGRYGEWHARAECFRFHVRTGEWDEHAVAHLSTARSQPCATLFNHKLYVAGGTAEDHSRVLTVERLHPDKARTRHSADPTIVPRFTELEALPAGAHVRSLCAVEMRLIAFCEHIKFGNAYATASASTATASASTPAGDAGGNGVFEFVGGEWKPLVLKPRLGVGSPLPRAFGFDTPTRLCTVAAV